MLEIFIFKNVNGLKTRKQTVGDRKTGNVMFIYIEKRKKDQTNKLFVV